MKKISVIIMVGVFVTGLLSTQILSKTKITWMRHGMLEDLQSEERFVEWFQQVRPDIIVESQVLPWGEFNQKIPMMIAGGTAPDSFAAHPALAMQTWWGGHIFPINEFVETDPELNYEDLLFKWDGVYEDEIIGLPMQSSAHMLRYNGRLFREAGLSTPLELWNMGKEGTWNWKSFVELGKKLTKDLDGDGKTDQWASGLFWQPNLIALIYAFGGTPFNEDYSECTLDSPQSLDAIRWIVDLAQEHKIMKLLPLDQYVGVRSILWGRQQIAMDNQDTFGALNELQKRYPFEWNMVVLPAGPAGFSTWGDTDQMIVSKTSSDKRAVYDWIKFRSSASMWERAYQENIPITGSPARSPVWVSQAFKDAWFPLDTNHLLTVVRDYTWQVPRTPYLMNLILTYLPTEISNGIMGIKSAEDVAKDLVSLMNEVMSE